AAPAAFPLGDARAWLEWRLEVERDGVALAADDDATLKRARHHWRPDLYAVRSPGAFLVTPIRDFRRVGRCLGYARVVVGALRSFFPVEGNARQPAPVTVFLYDDRESYQRHAQDLARLADPSFLERSSGHWSLEEDILHAVWSDDRDGEARFLGAFAREVTQQWLHGHNPRYTVSQAFQGYKSAGAWVRLGLVQLMSEGSFDPAGGEWSLFNARSECLDVVRALSESGAGLRPWPTFFLLTVSDTATLPDDEDVTMELRWPPGRFAYTPYGIFHRQAGAVSHFLYHAENGKYRARLFEYVVNQATGRSDKLSPHAAFGMSPEELGNAVEAFAKQVGGGWRPE
ncbi:MAG: hypothetical protein ACREID_01745, partial [Planctomycetota bacterium]